MRKMKRQICHILSFLMIALSPALIKAGVKEHKEESFLETTIEKKNVVEGERLIYEVRLFSTDPSVAGTEVADNPDFSDMPATRTAADTRLREVERKGKKYYSAVIDRFFIGANTTGRHKLKGGKYRIGYNRAVRIDDPFWGPSYANRLEIEEKDAPDVEIKVTSLPQNGRPEDFSGAIGEYELTLTLPEGEIIAGENTIAILTLSGKGDLTNIPAPDARQGFRDGLLFRSMTDNRQHFVTGGSLGSEIDMECIFYADKPGKYTIHPISFTYFDSGKGEYKRISTQPMEIEVTEDKVKSQSPPAIMNI